MGFPIYHSQYTAAQIEASIGKTPRIKSSTRTWLIWDIATSAYVDTGVSIDTELFVDSTLTEAGYAADARVTGVKLGELRSRIDNGPLDTDEAKQALLACFANVAWIGNDGQDYYDALYTALYPPTDLVSISAVYTQSGAVYATDSLNSLKNDLVVRATYSDSSTEVVTNYTLSGTLTEGTSTITVSYGGKTATFDVTVTHWIINVDVSKIVVGISNNGQSPSYYSQNNTRMSYPAFDLLLDGGKTYKFTVTSSINTAQLGVQAFNQIALDAVNAGIDFNSSGSTGEVWDVGWQGLEYIAQIPLTQHSSPIVGVRFAFRQSTSNPTISSNFVTAMTIEVVTE